MSVPQKRQLPTVITGAYRQASAKTMLKIRDHSQEQNGNETY